MFLGYSRWIKTEICKCQREQSRQNEKRGRAQTNENAADMETDYKNLSEMCRSQHYHIKYLKNFKIPNLISTGKVQLR